MVKEIAFTAYPAKSVEELRGFYADALGLKFTAPYVEEGILKYDEAQIGSGWFALVTSDWSEVTPNGGVAFEVDDLVKTLADLKQRGVSTDEIHETPVCKIASFTDPEGNNVTLHQTTVAH